MEHREPHERISGLTNSNTSYPTRKHKRKTKTIQRYELLRDEDNRQQTNLSKRMPSPWFRSALYDSLNGAIAVD
jgi:hypothetical protein